MRTLIVGSSLLLEPGVDKKIMRRTWLTVPWKLAVDFGFRRGLQRVEDSRV